MTTLSPAELHTRAVALHDRVALLAEQAEEPSVCSEHSVLTALSCAAALHESVVSLFFTNAAGGDADRETIRELSGALAVVTETLDLVAQVVDDTAVTG
jgi:hypothetical protein